MMIRSKSKDKLILRRSRTEIILYKNRETDRQTHTYRIVITIPTDKRKVTLGRDQANVHSLVYCTEESDGRAFHWRLRANRQIFVVRLERF